MSCRGAHEVGRLAGAWCDREADVEKEDEIVEPPAAGEEAGGRGEEVTWEKGTPRRNSGQSSGKRSAVQA